jgi:GTPase SAR1 family protein
MFRISRFFIPAVLAFLFVGCQTEKPEETYTQEEMQRFEQELRDEVKARRIDIVQMKEDVEQLAETRQQKFMERIDTIESRFVRIESDIDTLKHMNDDNWNTYKSQIDSTMDYLELQIDTTRVNIEQALLNQQEE